MFAGWLLVSALVFSYMGGMVHPYYTVAMAPAVAGLVGIGTIWAWRERAGWDGRIALAAMIVLAAASGRLFLLHRNVFGPAWLPWTIVPPSSIAAAVTVIVLGAHGQWPLRSSSGCWPRSAGRLHSRSPPRPRHTRARSRLRLNKGAILLGNWMGDEGNNADLAGVLADTHTEWSAATNGSQSAAALEISSGTSVMAIGGWSGDPVPTLRRSSTTCARARSRTTSRRAGAASAEDRGEVVHGRNRSAAHSREIADWVARTIRPPSSANPRSTG